MPQTCEHCDSIASETTFSGMSGPRGDVETPVCHAHYAQWLFGKEGAECIQPHAKSLCYVPVVLAPSVDNDRLWAAMVKQVKVDDEWIDQHIIGGHELLNDVVNEIQKELFVSQDNYDKGGAVGFLLIDLEAEHDSIMTYGALPKNDNSRPKKHR